MFVLAFRIESVLVTFMDPFSPPNWSTVPVVLSRLMPGDNNWKAGEGDGDGDGDGEGDVDGDVDGDGDEADGSVGSSSLTGTAFVVRDVVFSFGRSGP